MPGAPILAVQVVNYRTRAYLERCLPTVISDLDDSGLGYEINLLDNASGEDLEGLAQAVSRCRAFKAPRNLGFGAGHNLLANTTRASYLLILNPDVEFLAQDTAKRLLKALMDSDRVKAAGPKLITASGTPQRWDHGRLHGLRAQIALRGGLSYWRETDVRQEVAWVSGAVLLIERAAFEALGGFDDNLFLYKEEEDLCLRLRHHGGIVIYDPAVVVRHRGSVVANRSQAIGESTNYFIAKHFPHRRAQKAFAAASRGLAYLGL